MENPLLKLPVPEGLARTQELHAKGELIAAHLSEWLNSKVIPNEVVLQSDGEPVDAGGAGLTVTYYRSPGLLQKDEVYQNSMQMGRIEVKGRNGVILKLKLEASLWTPNNKATYTAKLNAISSDRVFASLDVTKYPEIDAASKQAVAKILEFVFHPSF